MTYPVFRLNNTARLLKRSFFQTLVTEITEFLALLLPLTCALCVINSIITAAVTKSVSKNETGTILGVNMATNSSIRSFAPSVGGYLMGAFGFEAIGYLGVVCNFAVLGLLKMSSFKKD